MNHIFLKSIVSNRTLQSNHITSFVLNRGNLISDFGRKKLSATKKKVSEANKKVNVVNNQLDPKLHILYNNINTYLKGRKKETPINFFLPIRNYLSSLWNDGFRQGIAEAKVSINSTSNNRSDLNIGANTPPPCGSFH